MQEFHMNFICNAYEIPMSFIGYSVKIAFFINEL